MTPRDRLIVALDFPSREDALRLVDALGDAVLWYKVGLELYLAEGAPMVQELRNRGKQVFLDLKLHDIPNTVAAAVRAASRMGASMLTLHAAGGPEMLQAAARAAPIGLKPETGDLQLLGVTVLTSMDRAQLQAIGIQRTPAEQVLLLGPMAMQSGMAGLVCSAEEVALLREQCGGGVLLIVPGIRSAQDAVGDQRRIASASEAIRSGATRVVVGRPITRASNPFNAAERILSEMDAVGAS